MNNVVFILLIILIIFISLIGDYENRQLRKDINVNKEQLDDTIDELKELNDTRPYITIRNNKNVYVTINYFNKEAE